MESQIELDWPVLCTCLVRSGQDWVFVSEVVRATLPYCSLRDSASYLARLVPLVTSGRLILDGYVRIMPSLPSFSYLLQDLLS